MTASSKKAKLSNNHGIECHSHPSVFLHKKTDFMPSSKAQNPHLKATRVVDQSVKLHLSEDYALILQSLLQEQASNTLPSSASQLVLHDILCSLDTVLKQRYKSANEQILEDYDQTEALAKAQAMVRARIKTTLEAEADPCAGIMLNFDAKIRYLTKEEGGRDTPVLSGGWSHIPLSVGLNGAIITSLDGAEVFTPGKSFQANIAFFWVNCFSAPEIVVGYRFPLQEASQLIGYGTVTNLNS
ncbi:hypothetical protein O4H49_03425 [Kiloniella laminariae]|uniref:Uncharacterized protein n=1 Tax=Kiloniella laminariae TaxID=454162 RepID=A0ABT4LFE6_9PROT|nr:hypothetical protein [Kiloniella laminariae]MCZ4279813.1 hypothetical protein [Kiloniella laminariae]